MSAAVCYFLVYFSEALILLQYSSNVFEYKISSIKRYMLLTILFIPIYFISFAHIGLLNTALFFVATFVFLKISTMENSATLFSAAFNDFLSSGANIHIHQSSLLLVLFPASLMNHIFAPINNQHSLFVYKAIFISRSHSITGVCFHCFIGRIIIYRIRRSSSFITLI